MPDSSPLPPGVPTGVRKVPAPSVRWRIGTVDGYQFDGYVFDSDGSDLALFMRWLASTRTMPNGQPFRLFLDELP
jgi:hypothetical protein